MKELNVRKRLRIEGYDYSQEGYYFITICTKDRRCILSEALDDELDFARIQLFHQGIVAEKYINKIHEIYWNVTIDEYVIMPNHIHMILTIDKECGNDISRIIKQYKSMVTRELGTSIWHKSFYEHIIRDEKEYLGVKKYIKENPGKWKEDEDYAKDGIL